MVSCVATASKPQEHGFDGTTQECPRIGAVSEEFESVSVNVDDLCDVREVDRDFPGAPSVVKVIVV